MILRLTLLALALAPSIAFAVSEPIHLEGEPIVVNPGNDDLPQGPRAKKWEALWKSAGMDGLVSVRDLLANGRRPVVVYVSAGHDPARRYVSVVYFHGHGGDLGSHAQQSGLLARIKWLASIDSNTIFICPEARAKPFHYWMRAPDESYRRLEEVALAEAARLVGQTIVVDGRLVSAFSGGGLALRNAVVSGQFAADTIEFLDCNYGDWGMVVADWAAGRPAGQRPRIVTWNTPGSTRQHDAEIKRKHPELVTVNESPVGHHDVPGRLLGSVLVD